MDHKIHRWKNTKRSTRDSPKSLRKKVISIGVPMGKTKQGRNCTLKNIALEKK